MFKFVTKDEKIVGSASDRTMSKWFLLCHGFSRFFSSDLFFKTVNNFTSITAWFAINLLIRVAVNLKTCHFTLDNWTNTFIMFSKMTCHSPAWLRVINRAACVSTQLTLIMFIIGYVPAGCMQHNYMTLWLVISCVRLTLRQIFLSVKNGSFRISMHQNPESRVKGEPWV